MKEENKWIFILGASSGFGLAIAEKFSKEGHNLILVHRDRKVAIEDIRIQFDKFRQNGSRVIEINTNAITSEGRKLVYETIEKNFKKTDKIKLFVHSIADGNIGMLKDQSVEEIESNLLHTINAMGVSFLIYTKELVERKLFANDARIIGFTSEGSTRYLKGYSFVGAAKSVLESLCRSMAIEFAPLNITTNLINPGITKTQALKVLPEHKELMEKAKDKNPKGRLTETSDIANIVWLLSKDESAWINGEIIRVDGGEQLRF